MINTSIRSIRETGDTDDVAHGINLLRLRNNKKRTYSILAWWVGAKVRCQLKRDKVVS